MCLNRATLSSPLFFWPLKPQILNFYSLGKTEQILYNAYAEIVFSSSIRVVSSGKLLKCGTQASVIQVHPIFSDFMFLEFFKDPRRLSLIKAWPNKLK